MKKPYLAVDETLAFGLFRVNQSLSNEDFEVTSGTGIRDKLEGVLDTLRIEDLLDKSLRLGGAGLVASAATVLNLDCFRHIAS